MITTMARAMTRLICRAPYTPLRRSESPRMSQSPVCYAQPAGVRLSGCTSYIRDGSGLVYFQDRRGNDSLSEDGCLQPLYLGFDVSIRGRRLEHGLRLALFEKRLVGIRSLAPAMIAVDVIGLYWPMYRSRNER